MLRLGDIEFTENGRRIDYHYAAEGAAQKYVNEKELLYAKYGMDVSKIPESIANIPFLCNWLPISWFGNFDIEVKQLDMDFYKAMIQVKAAFQDQFPDYVLGGNLLHSELVENKINGDKSAMLFSGGVDAYATYIRIYDKTPDLVTILGADIDINDKKQWNDFTEYVENEALLNNNVKHYIETNVRQFYTYQVELMLKDIGWWGKVQHGLSLLGSVAPLSYLQKYSDIYIASSYTEQVDIAWGSTPDIDNNVSWAGIKVHHDGYELKRQDKVDSIASFAARTETKFKLRVCYSELRTEFNCSNCEKCFRTILGIILNNEDPNNYGFKVNEDIYTRIIDSIGSGGASKGLQYFWWELMEKAKATDKVFVFKNAKKEAKELDKIRNGILHDRLEQKIQSQNKTGYRLRFILRNKFPRLLKVVKKIIGK